MNVLQTAGRRPGGRAAERLRRPGENGSWPPHVRTRSSASTTSTVGGLPRPGGRGRRGDGGAGRRARAGGGVLRHRRLRPGPPRGDVAAPDRGRRCGVAPEAPWWEDTRTEVRLPLDGDDDGDDGGPGCPAGPGPGRGPRPCAGAGGPGQHPPARAPVLGVATWCSPRWPTTRCGPSGSTVGAHRALARVGGRARRGASVRARRRRGRVLVGCGAAPAETSRSWPGSWVTPGPGRQPRSPPRGAAPDKQAAAHLLLTLVAEQTAQLHAPDAAVRADAPGAVHKLRIAARRMRSALTTYKALLERGRRRPVARGAALARPGARAGAGRAGAARAPGRRPGGGGARAGPRPCRPPHRRRAEGGRARRQGRGADGRWTASGTSGCWTPSTGCVADPPLTSEGVRRGARPRAQAAGAGRQEAPEGSAGRGARRDAGTPGTWPSTRPGRRRSGCATRRSPPSRRSASGPSPTPRRSRRSRRRSASTRTRWWPEGRCASSASRRT